MKRVILLLISMISFSLLLGEVKIGWVDTQSIFSESEELKQAYSNLDKKRNELQSVILKKKNTLDSLIIDYQTKELMLSSESLSKLEEEINLLNQEIQFSIQSLDNPTGELAIYFDQLVLPIQNRLLSAIEKIAFEQAYDYILDCSMGACLFQSETHNLTGLVKDELKKMAIDSIEE